MIRTKEPILKFEREGLKTLHFFKQNLLFPVAIATYDAKQEQLVEYLYQAYAQKRMKLEDICIWCMRHGVKYQIMYPLETFPMFKDPLRYVAYKKMLKKIRGSK